MCVQTEPSRRSDTGVFRLLLVQTVVYLAADPVYVLCIGIHVSGENGLGGGVGVDVDRWNSETWPLTSLSCLSDPSLILLIASAFSLPTITCVDEGNYRIRHHAFIHYTTPTSHPPSQTSPFLPYAQHHASLAFSPSSILLRHMSCRLLASVDLESGRFLN